MRYVRATGRFTFTDGNQRPDERIFRCEPGDVIEADHWAVRDCHSAGWFVAVDDVSTPLHPSEG